MSPSTALAERIRDALPKKSNYAVAKALGVTQTNLKQILEGKRGFGTEACIRASQILRVPVEHVIAEIELPRAKTAEKRAFWEKQLPRILPAVAIFGIAAGVTDVSLVVGGEGLTTVSQAIHYAACMAAGWAVSRWAMLRRTGFALAR